MNITNIKEILRQIPNAIFSKDTNLDISSAVIIIKKMVMVMVLKLYISHTFHAHADHFAFHRFSV